jgi:hypothetical protein
VQWLDSASTSCHWFDSVVCLDVRANAGDHATLLSAVRAQASEVRSLISRTEQMERTPHSRNGGSSSEAEGKALVLPMGPDDFIHFLGKRAFASRPCALEGRSGPTVRAAISGRQVRCGV